jgi:Ca2+-binding EF-hand superfamily protein
MSQVGFQGFSGGLSNVANQSPQQGPQNLQANLVASPAAVSQALQGAGGASFDGLFSGSQCPGCGVGPGFGLGGPSNGFQSNGFQRPDPSTIMSQADTDRNGSLSKSEFMNFTPTRPDGTQGPQLPPEIKERIFARIDANGDGNITQQELANAPRPRFGAGGGLARIIGQADTDKNGAVSQAEFQNFTPTLPDGRQAPQISPEKKNEIFARIDTNRDGQLTRDELANAPRPQGPPPFLMGGGFQG